MVQGYSFWIKDGMGIAPLKHRNRVHTLEVNMKKADLQKKIARLESINDYLTTELGYLDQLMRMVGFSGGLETVKLTAKELYQAEKEGRTLDFS